MISGQRCPLFFHRMNLTAAPPSSVELEVERVRALTKQYRYQEALRAADTLRREVPENRDVFYLIAICQRQLGQIPEGLSTFGEPGKKHSPPLAPLPQAGRY